MYLTLPTLEELLHSDLDELVDMLAKRSEEYTRLHKLEGRSKTANATKEFVERLQEAIQIKKSGGNSVP